jgi:uncharacterized alkaline shock family protein YloU
VLGLVDGPLHRGRGVRVTDDDGAVSVELRLSVAWGADVPALGSAVQERVHAYLGRMADVTPTAVDVVVEEFGPAPAS